MEEKNITTHREISFAKNRGESKYIGLLFILPWIFGFICFKAGPLAMSFIVSFTKYNVMSSPKWIGLDNFTKLFTSADFWMAARVNLEYVLMTVPIRLSFSLFIAYVLTSSVKGIGVFRALYYIPSLMGGNVAIAILWRYLFLKEGLINSLLLLVGIQGKAWIAGDFSALFIVSLLHVWQFGATMVIFLAALKGIPMTLKEAALIDGASSRAIFFRITIPYISPVIFFNLLTNMVTAFQEFNSPFMVTGGGPGKATTLMSLLIYNNAFKFLKMGYSSALSVILFLTIVIVTVMLFASSKKWVNYQD
jgi:oligogalacturonide transport system permease protein